MPRCSSPTACTTGPRRLAPPSAMSSAEGQPLARPGERNLELRARPASGKVGGMHQPSLLRPLVLALLLLSLSVALARADDAATQVLKWKDGKKAPFFLGFDDSAPSQLKNVVPE